MKFSSKLFDELFSEVVTNSHVEPRPYQGRIVKKSACMFNDLYLGVSGDVEKNINSVMIESPTGSGKTVMGLMSMRLQQLAWGSRGYKVYVGWIAMRRNLLTQAALENGPRHTAVDEDGNEREVGKAIGVENISFVSMFDKQPDALLEARARRDAGEKVKILFNIDEAQHDAASSCMHLHNAVEPDKILGLSATPFRTDRMKLCFNKVIKDAGIHALIQDGYLSPYDHYTIPDWSPRSVFEAYVREPERWGKSAFYFKDLSLCGELAGLFRGAGLSYHLVTGSTDVETQLDQFRSGVVPRLINCMKLTEGWDEPSLQTAWVRDSGKSCTMQIGGRAFRIHKKTPRKNIVQGKLTRWPFIRTAMPVQQYLWQESEWRSLTVNPHLALINQNARVAIASCPVELPKFLVDRQKTPAKKLKF